MFEWCNDYGVHDHPAHLRPWSVQTIQEGVPELEITEKELNRLEEIRGADNTREQASI